MERCALELTPAEIRRQQFEQVRRGFDPQEVGVFLEKVAAMVSSRDKDLSDKDAEIQRLERALDEAKAAEEAVRLTMVAATKAKDEILAGANQDAGEMLESAKGEAEAALAGARREALSVIEESRKDAEELMESARAEHAQLLERAEVMRNVVLKAGNLLKGMASGALEDLGHAAALLEGTNGTFDPADFEVVVDDVGATVGESAVAVAVDPVDRLLEQLREVGG